MAPMLRHQTQTAQAPTAQIHLQHQLQHQQLHLAQTVNNKGLVPPSLMGAFWLTL